jgi:hypothetical protein
MAENEILTKQGKIDLEKKLQNLVNVEKPKALADLNLARSQGDLSENADYDAAREKTQEIESEINQIQYTLMQIMMLPVKRHRRLNLRSIRSSTPWIMPPLSKTRTRMAARALSSAVIRFMPPMSKTERNSSSSLSAVPKLILPMARFPTPALSL